MSKVYDNTAAMFNVVALGKTIGEYNFFFMINFLSILFFHNRLYVCNSTGFLFC